MLNFKPSIRMRKKDLLTGFEPGMVAESRWAGLNILGTADLLKFLHAMLSMVYREWS